MGKDPILNFTLLHVAYLVLFVVYGAKVKLFCSFFLSEHTTSLTNVTQWEVWVKLIGGTAPDIL